MTNQDILAEADRCVKCGLCLPHCPTYRLSADESESPRGRLALMCGFASGKLPYTPKLEQRLNHCLGCGACEPVCPSQVHYRRVLDATRKVLRQRRHPAGNLVSRSLLALVTSRRPLEFSFRLLRFYQQLGLARFGRAIRFLNSGFLQRADALLPPLIQPRPLASRYDPSGPETGKVALFLGCVEPHLAPELAQAAIRVLTRCHRSVLIPPGQGCCGALHQHAGYTTTATRLEDRNAAAFGAADIEAVVSTASGCAAHLVEQGERRGEERPPVREIGAYLRDIGLPQAIRLRPFPGRVLVHEPCSLRNQLKVAEATYWLLGRIPGIELLALPGNEQCCGAAGAYMLSQGETADALRDEKVDAVEALRPSLIVSSNIGCALHLAAGLRGRGVPVEVLHPVQLLARQLEPDPVADDRPLPVS